MKHNAAVTLLFCLIAPAAISFCLIVLGSAALTFLVFYLGVCTLIPAADILLSRLNRLNRRDPQITPRPQTNLRTRLGLVYSAGSLRGGIISGLIFGAAVFVFFALLREMIIDQERLRTMLASWNIDRSAGPALFLVMILANPVFEEFYWRSFIIHRFCTALRPPAAIIISSLGYTSYHLITVGFLFGLTIGLLLSVPVFFAGVFWGWMRLKSGSLLGVIVSHILADVGIMAVYGLYMVDLLG